MDSHTPPSEATRSHACITRLVPLSWLQSFSRETCARPVSPLELFAWNISGKHTGEILLYRRDRRGIIFLLVRWIGTEHRENEREREGGKILCFLGSRRIWSNVISVSGLMRIIWRMEGARERGFVIGLTTGSACKMCAITRRRMILTLALLTFIYGTNGNFSFRI